METELLKVNNLQTFFYTEGGIVKAVDRISFTVNQGDTLGIVGESGCGKSTVALSIMGLIFYPPGRIESGEVYFQGKNLLDLSKEEMRKVRGDKISMIFQEPMTSLNPVFTIGDQISTSIKLHQGLSKKEAFDKAIEMLHLVRIPSPERRIHDYPYQMSGGMRQRVMIAMALSCQPKLMLADEPTTALDVTIQLQIFDIMQKLKEKTGTSIILITHDQGVIAETVQSVMVMYAGKIMEYAMVDDLFENPYHPYTKGLLKTIPGLAQTQNKKELYIIPGRVPNLLNLPEGCKFSNRCKKSFTKCFKEEPPLFEITPGHLCRCWLYS